MLTIDGGLVMSNTATLRIEIGGRTVGADYDRLAVTGAAILSGRLAVTLINGFVPTNGDSFAVLTCGARSNVFTSAEVPALPADVVWDVGYGGTSVTLRVVGANEDSDGDGMPNGWEHAHFGSATGGAPGGDNDGDGYLNGDEYVADTNPTNAASHFPAITNIGATVWILEMDPTSTGRVYDVLRSTDLLDGTNGWMPYGFDRTGTGGRVTFTITNAGPTRFYRTGVRLP